MTLVDLLIKYKPLSARDADLSARFLRFVQSDPRCYDRSNATGHLTGSAWLVDPTGRKVLLTQHKKLGKWLQLGGHADGETDLLSVALREAKEESGLTAITPVSSEIFDLDIHRIPAIGDDPEHDHYDVRFAFQAAVAHPLHPSEESHALAWTEIDRLHDVSKEESLLRMAEKWKLTGKTQLENSSCRRKPASRS